MTDTQLLLICYGYLKAIANLENETANYLIKMLEEHLFSEKKEIVG